MKPSYSLNVTFGCYGMACFNRNSGLPLSSASTLF